MGRNLFGSIKATVHSDAVAAGLTVITPSAGVDMANFDSCMFLVHWGAITAGGAQSVEVHQSDDDGVGDAYSALLGSKVTVADTADDTITAIEVKQPLKRYLKCIVNRATQNSEVNSIIALQGGAANMPVGNTGEHHLSPAEGTA